MRFVQPADRTQFVMMNSLDDLVASDHPVRLIDSVVEQIVKSNPEEFGTDRVDSDPGRPAFSPQTLLKLFLYGYLINCRASRKLEAETKRNIELIWLLGTLSPDHWVIAQYRKLHGGQIRTATKAFRQFLHAHGYIRAKRVAVDGTKIRANARREMLTVEKIEKRLEHLDDQLEEYLSKLAENDIRDDLAEELETVRSNDGPSGEGGSGASEHRHLIDKIVALEKQIEELNAHRETLHDSERRYLSPTDPDASLMKTGEGKRASYNVQSAVDEAHHMIAATEVVTDAVDAKALPGIVNAVTEELGVTPHEIIADKGYYTPDLIEQVEMETGTTCYIPPQSPTHDQEEEPQASASPITFHYDQSTDRYTCSEGKPLVLRQKNMRSRSTVVNVYRGTECGACSLRSQCTTSATARSVFRYHNQPWRDQYHHRLKQRASRAIVALRKRIVEHPFGTIKLWGGKLPLLLRGRAKVAIEIDLYATAYNLRRLLQCAGIERVREQVASYSWKLA